MSRGDYYYNERDRYGSQPDDDYDDDDDPRYQQPPSNYYRGEEDHPRVYGRRYDPNLNPAADDRGPSYGPGRGDPYRQPRQDEQDDHAHPAGYSNAAYDEAEEWGPPRVYGRRNDPRKYDDEYPNRIDPEGPRYGPYGGENQTYDSRPNTSKLSKHDDVDDGGFGGPHQAPNNTYEKDFNGGRHPSGDRTLQTSSVDSHIPRSPGMDDLAREAAPPLPPRTVAQSSAPVNTQLQPSSGKWTCPPWLYRPAWILGISQIVLGVVLLIFGSVAASFSHPQIVKAGIGEGIWGGLVISGAGAMMVCIAWKKKELFAYIAIGLTAGGVLVDIIIFGLCGTSIKNVLSSEFALNAITGGGSLGINVARPNYGAYYAMYGLLIVCAYIHLVVAIVAMVFLSVSILKSQEQANFIKEYLNPETSTWAYPKILFKPAKITAICQIVLGILMFIFGSVTMSFHGQYPPPPGVTAAEGIWGGTIAIGAGVLTLLAAKLKTKFFLILVITMTSLSVLVDILIFGICGFVVDELNEPHIIDARYMSVYPRPSIGLWTAIYDVLIVIAFIHIVVALVVLVIHVLVFVPSKYLPQQKKAPVHSQARIVSQNQGNNVSVSMVEGRPSAAGQPRRIDIVDSRDINLRQVPPRYGEEPPRYEDLPPSPDPYNTGVGYNLSFVQAKDERPQYQDHQMSGYKGDRKPSDDVRRQPNYSDNEPQYPQSGAQPYSERDYSRRDPPNTAGEPVLTSRDAPRFSVNAEPYDRETRGPRHPNGREPVSYGAKHPSDDEPYPSYQRPQPHGHEVDSGDHSPGGRGESASYARRPHGQYPSRNGNYGKDRLPSQGDHEQRQGGTHYTNDSRSQGYESRPQPGPRHNSSGREAEYSQRSPMQNYDDQEHDSYYDENAPYFGRSSGI
ncbi:uncharacterized protein LOC135483322 [Lineus longissimus]|uniref:uncharacterized protein LOC135483322 n=1 Tax=Lineus longissimus TaxID=88925 RepID=UPI00315DD1ED